LSNVTPPRTSQFAARVHLLMITATTAAAELPLHISIFFSTEFKAYIINKKKHEIRIAQEKV